MPTGPIHRGTFSAERGRREWVEPLIANVQAAEHTISTVELGWFVSF
jgi:hypothetical protein